MHSKLSHKCCTLHPDLVQATILGFLFFQSEVLASNHKVGSKSRITPENDLDLLTSAFLPGGNVLLSGSFPCE